MTNKELAIILLDKQYSIVGLSFEEACNMEREEFIAYKMTLEQQREWSENFKGKDIIYKN